MVGVGDAQVEDGGSRGQVLHQGRAVGGGAEHGCVVVDVQDVEVHPDGRGLASPVLSAYGQDVILLSFVVQRPRQVEDAGDGVEEEDSLFVILADGVRDLPVDARVVVGGEDGCHKGTCAAQQHSAVRHLQQLLCPQLRDALRGTLKPQHSLNNYSYFSKAERDIIFLLLLNHPKKWPGMFFIFMQIRYQQGQKYLFSCEVLSSCDSKDPPTAADNHKFWNLLDISFQMQKPKCEYKLHIPALLFETVPLQGNCG